MHYLTYCTVCSLHTKPLFKKRLIIVKESINFEHVRFYFCLKVLKQSTKNLTERKRNLLKTKFQHSTTYRFRDISFQRLKDFLCSVASKNFIFHTLDSYLFFLSMYFCNTDPVTHCWSLAITLFQNTCETFVTQSLRKFGFNWQHCRGNLPAFKIIYCETTVAES